MIAFPGMRLHYFTFNAFSENTYILSDNNRQALIIDPGCSNEAENDQLNRYIIDEKLEPVAILLTHAHIDHIMGNAFVKETFNLPIYLHPLEFGILSAAPKYASYLGVTVRMSPPADFPIEPNTPFSMGGFEFDIRFTPGHSPGSVCFILHEHRVVIGGDVLFDGSIGRTDLPGGDYNTLEKSILSELYSLPDDYIVYPGHGSHTTIGKEKLTNPFVKGV